MSPDPHSVLLIKGLDIVGISWYADHVLRSKIFESARAKLTILDYKYDQCETARAEILSALRARRHNTVIVCDLSEYHDQFVLHFGDALRHFVRLGGRVAFPTCEGLLLLPVLRRLFQVQWKEGMYGRAYWCPADACADQVDRLFPLKRLHSGKILASELKYHAKACSYKNVPKHEAFFGNTVVDHSVFSFPDFSQDSDSDEEEKEEMWQYAVAVRRYGDGIVAFFGDVNADPPTCDLIASFALADVASVDSAAEGSTEEKVGAKTKVKSKVKKEAKEEVDKGPKAKMRNCETRGKMPDESAESNEADVTQAKKPDVSPGVCLACGKGGVTMACGRCRSNGIVSRYCSQDCQRASWPTHKKFCGTRAAGPVETEVEASQGATATFDVSAVLAGASQSEGGNPGLHFLLSDRKNWWEGLSEERQRERFCMSYQLRNEDAYVFRGEMLGPYNPDSSPSAIHGDFRRYHAKALRKGLLPESCKGNFINSAYAKENCKYAIEKSDIVKQFGYASGEHMVLRRMAETITGQSTV